MRGEIDVQSNDPSVHVKCLIRRASGCVSFSVNCGSETLEVRQAGAMWQVACWCGGTWPTPRIPAASCQLPWHLKKKKNLHQPGLGSLAESPLKLPWVPLSSAMGGTGGNAENPPTGGGCVEPPPSLWGVGAI